MQSEVDLAKLGVILEGRLVQHDGAWVIEGYDKLLYPLADYLARFEGRNARVVVADLDELEAMTPMLEQTSLQPVPESGTLNLSLSNREISDRLRKRE